MHYAIIPTSFGACGALYLFFFHVGGCSAEESCSRVSLVHHVIAMILGLLAHWKYMSSIADDASFAPNESFPLAVSLQQFNIGYFLYDSIHAAVWDQKWLAHHTVAILGFVTSNCAGVFALANAVNTWITEVGSLLYSLHLVKKTDKSYVAFVTLYTLSRSYFVYWSCHVLRQAWFALNGKSRFYPSFWTPYAAAGLQVTLLLININFVAVHWQKLRKKYLRGGKSAVAKGQKAE